MSYTTAVILIALGGPRSLDEVGAFMSAFMGRPVPPPVVAVVIERYKLIGAKSPLPDIVKAQATDLERELGVSYRVYEGFRYSHPFIADAIATAIQNGADQIIGLSMSPFATEVTTGAYRRAFDAADSARRGKSFIASWNNNPLFIRAWCEKVSGGLTRFGPGERVATVFTSHSIPTRYITAGDPYRHQVEETVHLVIENLNIKNWRTAWQSKGARATEPWLEPEVEPTLDVLAQEGFTAVLEVPLGFTCDHMETLYDIDIVHRTHAAKLGLHFERAESLNTDPLFIKALADVITKSH